MKLNPKTLEFEDEPGEMFRTIYLPLLLYPGVPLLLLCFGHPALAVIWAAFAREECWD